MVLPLEGVRVLAQAIVWAGPAATLLLADLGAEVIEVESVQHLNPTRAPLRHLNPELADGPTGSSYADRNLSEGFWNRHANFNYAKRGHKSVTLALRQKDGLDLFYELVKKSDVFVENNAAAVVEHLHIDYPTLSKINPRLIMVRFPGFGLGGPYTYYKGFAPSFEAVIGHSSIRGYRDADATITPQISHGDANAGINVAFAVQAALIARERTGKGQLVELSHAEAVAPHITHAWMDYAMNGRVQGHWGNRHPSMAPYGVFRCAGPQEEWVALAVPSDEAFRALCEVMGQPELTSDERFADVVSRYQHQDDLEPLIEAWTSQHHQRELMERLQGSGCPAAMVARQPDLRDDPHLKERGFWIELDHAEVGRRPYPGPPAKFRDTPLTPTKAAPLLGEHNEEILKGVLGVSDERYQQLLDAHIIGDTYLETAT